MARRDSGIFGGEKMINIEELMKEYRQDKLLSRGFTVKDLGAGVTVVYKEIDTVLEDLQQLKSSLTPVLGKRQVEFPLCVDKWVEMYKSSRPIYRS